MTDKLRQAAQRLLAHWDSVAWKQTRPTADFMADLREALDNSLKPKCFADYQPNHAIDRACASCAIADECRTGEQPVSQDPFGWYSDKGGFNECGEGQPLYTAPQTVTTPDVCGEVCARAKLCYGCNKDLEEANAKYGEQAEQEPVGVVEGSGEWGIAGVLVAGVPIGTKLYAAPVRTKDLTDKEIRKLWSDAELDITWFARAVIAADREKNK